MNNFAKCRTLVRELSSHPHEIQTLPISHEEND